VLVGVDSSDKKLAPLEFDPHPLFGPLHKRVNCFAPLPHDTKSRA